MKFYVQEEQIQMDAWKVIIVLKRLLEVMAHSAQDIVQSYVNPMKFFVQYQTTVRRIVKIHQNVYLSRQM